MSDLHTVNHQNEPEKQIGVQELAAVSEVFADYTDNQDSKLDHITRQLEQLKALSQTEAKGQCETYRMSVACHYDELWTKIG